MVIEEVRWTELKGIGALVPGQAVPLYGNLPVRLHLQRTVLWQNEFLTLEEDAPPLDLRVFESAQQDLQSGDAAAVASARETLSYLHSVKLGSLGGHFCIGPSRGLFPLVHFAGVLDQAHAWNCSWRRHALSVGAWCESANAATRVIEKVAHWELLQECPHGEVQRVHVETRKLTRFRRLDSLILMAPGLALRDEVGEINYAHLMSLSMRLRSSMRSAGSVFISMPPAEGQALSHIPVTLSDALTRQDHLVWSSYDLPAWASEREPETLWQFTEPAWPAMVAALR